MNETLPNSESANAESGQSTGRGHFWALMAVTGLPFILAMVLFYNPDLMPDMGGGINKGQLVQPTRAMPDTTFETLDGKGFSTEKLKDQWTLLMVAGSDCDETCQRNLFFLRQIRLAMGEDRYRINRLMLVLDNNSLDGLAGKLEPFEGTKVIIGPESERARLKEILAIDSVALEGRIYTIDPQGRLVLGYLPNPAWKDVLKDLQHLLKIVQL